MSSTVRIIPSLGPPLIFTVPSALKPFPQVEYRVSGNFAYNQNKVSKYKGELQRGWVTDENGNRVYQTNIGDVSTGGSTRVIEGKMINEYYMLQPYKGSGNGFNADGTVNINGGPRDGMIRTGRPT